MADADPGLLNRSCGDYSPAIESPLEPVADDFQHLFSGWSIHIEHPEFHGEKQTVIFMQREKYEKKSEWLAASWIFPL